MEYKYPGPLIIVNENKPITVAKGTMSSDIGILIQNIAALNLTLIPSTPGFEILPYNVPIQVGQLYTYFRVSIPHDFSVGTYHVSWKLEGELIPSVYTPIKDTIIEVISI